MNARFPRKERLRSNKEIALLFDRGQTRVYAAFRFTWQLLDRQKDTEPAAAVAILVPKKIFRKASVRNLIRRRIREAYRKHKGMIWEVLEKNDQQLRLLILYTGSSVPAYAEIEEKLVRALKNWISQYEKDS